MARIRPFILCGCSKLQKPSWTAGWTHHLPSGYLTYGKWPIYRWFTLVYLLKLVIFHGKLLVIRWFGLFGLKLAMFQEFQSVDMVDEVDWITAGDQRFPFFFHGWISFLSSWERFSWWYGFSMTMKHKSKRDGSIMKIGSLNSSQWLSFEIYLTLYSHIV